MKIAQLCIYPVKSLRGIELVQSELCVHGLTWDRRWMLVDEQQRFITQRQVPKLATIRVALTEQALVLMHDSVAPLSIPLAEPQGELIDVVVWGDTCKAIVEEDQASAWLHSVLGDQAKGIKLVRFAVDYPRSVEPAFLGGDEAHTYFSDGYPFLVTTTGSLAALNQALMASGNASVPMDRFRPNIVIECETPWAENAWAAISGPQQHYQLTIRKPCQRCKITTIDQQTAQMPTPGEPLKTLITLNKYPHLKGAYFGQNATLNMGGEQAIIRVGDEVVASWRHV